LPNDPIELARHNWERAGWNRAAGGMAALTSIMRVHQLMLADVERVLRPHGLTFARYEVLMLLHFSRMGVLPVGKIGERLQVHPASVTNAVDRLERDGHVRRVPNPTDGRSVLAEITETARELVGTATEQLNDEVFSCLPATPSELSDLYRLLRSLRREYGDFDDPGARGE
jgi:DNA-binding MarR family transcriptional regulator